MFLIYINDIDEGIVSRLSKFADDTKLYGKVSSTELVDQIRNDLLKISSWSEKWLMPFNVDKCKVMHLRKVMLKHNS